MKKYVVTICQEVKYMIVCAALLLSFFTTVNAAEKEAPEKIIRVGALGDTFNYVTTYNHIFDFLAYSNYIFFHSHLFHQSFLMI